MTTNYAPVVASTVVGVQGPAGSGAPGTKEYTGSGTPASNLGSNGDHYLNTANGDYYEKTAGAWGSPISNLTGPVGPQGSVLRNGGVAPNNATGVDGDYYLNSVNGNLYQRISGAYALIANLLGPQGLQGAAGVAGAAGAVWRSGAGAPSSSLGVNGDLYLDTAASNVYQKAAGAYSSIANIKGATGSAAAQYQGPLTINSLGDSISARGSYQPTGYVTNVPAWQANTPYGAVGTLVKVGTLVYRLTVAGTSGATGPTGTSSSTDGTATWQFCPPTASKSSTSWLAYAEAFSDGLLVWDMSQGYAGIPGSLIGVAVVQGGQGYSPSDTVTFTGGATGTLSVSNGTITGVNITNPGQPSAPFTYTINTSTGSGAVLSGKIAPSGTFAVTGCTSTDVLARVPDVLASTADIVTVLCGTNDITGGVPYATIAANLTSILAQLAAGGKIVVAMTLTPRASLTGIQMGILLRLNKLIRAFARKEAWANPNRIGIAILDTTSVLTDGASASNQPIGGVGGVDGEASDGLHPSPRAAQELGKLLLDAVRKFIGYVPDFSIRTYSPADGYDPVNNPGGNILEGLPWTASQRYELNAQVNNSGKVYRCTVAGTSAASGGPTVSSGTVADGSVTWAYVAPALRSVSGAGTAGVFTAATGITYSGSLATGTTLGRQSGSASGTVSAAIESPWSNFIAGQRQSLSFSLGGGTTSEIFNLLFFNSSIGGLGLTAADLGVTQLTAEIEIELANVRNLCCIYPQLQDTSGAFIAQNGNGVTSSSYHGINTASDAVIIPNNGKRILSTPPIVLPANATSLNLYLLMGWDASGAAGSAGADIKINSINFRRFGMG